MDNEPMLEVSNKIRNGSFVGHDGMSEPMTLISVAQKPSTEKNSLTIELELFEDLIGGSEKCKSTRNRAHQ